MADQDQPFPGGLATERLAIYNLATSASIKVQYNPRRLGRKLKAAYSFAAPPGMSHQREQYEHTDNGRHTFDLLWNATTPAELAILRQQVRFIQSLFYPFKAGNGSPPRVLLSAGDELGLVVRIEDLDEGKEWFNAQMQARYVVHKLTFFESRDGRLWGDDVLRDGDVRSRGGSI